MTQIQQIHEDLRFVRDAVARREDRPRRIASVYYVWAVYVLVGYALLDYDPGVATWFLMLGGVAGGVASALIGRRYAAQVGEYDRAEARREGLHWAGGVVLSVVAAFALAFAVPALRGQPMGQLIAVMIGLVYFLSGVHYDRNFLWLGPVLIAGGVLVGFVPRYGWTALGVVVAMGLVVPTFFPSRRPTEPTATATSQA
jgi:hypothetical protein